MQSRRQLPVQCFVADKQVVADWNELQHLTTALKQWRMLPDFSCLDEGTRIGTVPVLRLQMDRNLRMSSLLMCLVAVLLTQMLWP